MASSSTTAAGHQGTGVGTHNRQWVHYNAPTAPGTRVKFTRFNYDTANAAIIAATATKGSVTIASQEYTANKTKKCTNCQAVVPASPAPSYSGCPKASGRHNFVDQNSWSAAVATTHTLYYDKIGATTQVSMHPI
jgi:hypothetical protein